MASNVFNHVLTSLFTAEVDLDTDDIRAILVMSSSSAPTDKDGITTVSAITTLDESDASGYARVSITTPTVTDDDANDRAIYDADDIAFTAMGGDASRDYIGVVLYKHISSDGDSIPICFIEFTTPIPASATQVDVPWSAEGILHHIQG